MKHTNIPPLPFIQTLVHRRAGAHVRVNSAPYLRLTLATAASPARLGVVVSQGIYTHNFPGEGQPMRIANRAVQVPRSYNPGA
jgi:hypothetical protein